MSDPHRVDDPALRNLDARLDALAASRRRKPASYGSGGAEAGYQLVAQMVGGVLAGLGLGWTFDRLAHTAPLGLITGLLVGTGASVFLVARTAGRMSSAAPAAPAAAPVAVEDDEDEAERD